MRHLATIQKIEEIKSIKDADKIEALRVKGWWVVAQKGFNVGDKIVYFEIDSFLPIIPLFDFLLKGSSPKKMLVDGAEKEGIRLKTIKLKGQVSQGLVLPLKEVSLFSSVDLEALDVGDDITEELGVIKYEAPIAPELSGKVKGSFPAFLPKTDEERIQNMSEVLNQFYVSEKIDGTSTTYYKKDGVFGVCSRNLELAEGETTQWKIAKELNLPEIMPDNFALQGELVGEGIQNNPLKLKGHHIYFFNAYNIQTGKYLDYQNFVDLLKAKGLNSVPIIDDNFSLPKNVDEMLLYAEGKSLLNSDVEREGVVVRPKVEMDYNGQRFSFKAISNKYLLEGGE